MTHTKRNKITKARGGKRTDLFSGPSGNLFDLFCRSFGLHVLFSLFMSLRVRAESIFASAVTGPLHLLVSMCHVSVNMKFQGRKRPVDFVCLYPLAECGFVLNVS